MKMKRLNKIWMVLIAILVAVPSCTDDYLEVEVVDSITEENFYKTDEQFLSGTATLYGASFFKVNDKFTYSLDMLAGNSIGFVSDTPWKTFTVDTNNGTLYEGWSGLYRGIADANQILKMLARERDNRDISTEVRNRVEAEARFARAFSYYWLVRLWGPVPVIDKVTSDTSELYRLNTVESIYDFIEQDFLKAAELLPLASVDMRRIGKTAPWAYLAEMHLTKREYDKAAEFAKLVIDSGIHSLQPTYEEQFINPSASINSETIYAWQWKVNCGRWGSQNTNQAYLARFGEGITGDDGAFSSVTPSIDLYYAFDRIKQPDDVDNRRKFIIMEPDQFYPELKTAQGGYTFPNSKNVSGTFMGYRKYVVGSENEHPNVCFMRTEMSTQMMRYADVLMVYAEAIMGNADSTTDADALDALNQVRSRAGLPNRTLITKQSIIEERRIEFAIEGGKFWMDLLRIDRNLANDLLRDQNRGTLISYDPFVEGEEAVRLGNVVDGLEFLLPLPAGDLSFIDTQNPPVVYEPQEELNND